MTSEIQVVPFGFPVRLGNCRPGLFLFKNTLGFADEYGGYYVVESGEVFWGGTSDKEKRFELVVQPCIVQVVKE